MKLGLNLGYWGIGPRGEEARRDRPGRRERRLRLGLGGRVLRLRRGQRARLARPADRDDQARRRDHAGSRRALRRRRRWPAARSTPSRAGASSSASAPRARRSRRAGTASPTRSRGAARASTSRSCARSSPARTGSSYDGEHFELPLAGRRGQGAEAQLPPGAQPHPDLPRGDRPQVGRAGRRDRRRLDPDLLLARRLPGDLGRARRGGACEGRALAVRSRDLTDGPGGDRRRPRRRARVVKAGLLLYLGGMGSRKTNFYVDLTHRFGFGEVADEVQSPVPGRQARGRVRRDPRRAGRRDRAHRQRGRGGRPAEALRGRPASTG